MKTNVTLTVDTEVRDYLKMCSNASALVNELVKVQMGRMSAIGETKEEIIKQMNEHRIKLAEMDAKTQILNEQLANAEKEEALTKEAFKGIPDQILDDFRIYSRMTPEILKKRYNDIYSRRYKLEWQKLLNAYNVYFNKEQLSNPDIPHMSDPSTTQP